MFDIEKYNLGHEHLGKTELDKHTALINIIFHQGSGGNFLAYTTQTRLFELHIVSNKKNNEYSTSRNQRVTEILHMHDIYRTPNSNKYISRLTGTKLVVIDLPTMQHFKNVNALSKLKYSLNEGMEVETATEILEQELLSYKCLIDFKNYLIDVCLPNNIFLLDYYKFFIETDIEHITEYANFLGSFDEERISYMKDDIERYTSYNTEIMLSNGLEQFWQWNS